MAVKDLGRAATFPAIEKARAAFLEDSNKEIIAQMQFKVSEFN